MDIKNKAEQKRYDNIKKTGRYLEYNVLIGVDSRDELDGHFGKMPVVTTEMHGCSSKEVSYLYTTLKNTVEFLKTEYPLECLYAEIGMESKNLGSVEMSDDGFDLDEEE